MWLNLEIKVDHYYQYDLNILQIIKNPDKNEHS